MQAVLNNTSEVADWAGLRFNASKCAAMMVDGHARTTGEVHLTIQGEPIRAMGVEDSYRYLGIDEGFLRQKAADSLARGTQCDLDAINNSLLAPWQKIDALKIFVIPKLGFALRTAAMSKVQLRNLDASVQRTMKAWMQMPKKASTEPLYLPFAQGGVGAFPLGLLGEVCTVVQAIKMLQATDPRVRAIAKEGLKEFASNRKHTMATNQQAADFLNGKICEGVAISGGDISSLWSRARTATIKLAKTTDLRW